MKDEKGNMRRKRSLVRDNPKRFKAIQNTGAIIDSMRRGTMKRSSNNR